MEYGGNVGDIAAAGHGAKYAKLLIPALVWGYSSAYYEVDSATMDGWPNSDTVQIHRCFEKHGEQVTSPTARPLAVGQGHSGADVS